MWWRGRPITWNPDAQAIEQERQRWVYEKIDGMNTNIIELAVDPRVEYARHVGNYMQSGDERELRLALEYVR